MQFSGDDPDPAAAAASLGTVSTSSKECVRDDESRVRDSHCLPIRSLPIFALQIATIFFFPFFFSKKRNMCSPQFFSTINP